MNRFSAIAFVIFLTLGTICDAGSIRWRSSVGEAAKEARGSGKPMLIEISTDWCHYCKKMEQETLSDKSIATHISNCFVPLKLDGDMDRAIVRQLGVQSFPTMVVVTPDMKVLRSIRGFRTPKQLSGDLASICQHDHVAAAVRAKPRRLSVFGDFCPVTSLTQGKASVGDAKYAMQYQGFDLVFNSDQARVAFDKSPQSYWPVMAGACVVTGLESNKLEFGKWAHSARWADRIWLFASQEKKDQFFEQPQEFAKRLEQQLGQKN